MASIVKLTPLYGALAEQPLCSVLEIDELLILLDCGWSDAWDEALLRPLAKVAPRVSLVLLSHPDLAHCGALPYAMAKLGLTNAKVVATLPVHKLGQMFLYDAVLSRSQYEDFSAFSLDDIDAAFDAIVPLKYSQRYTVNAGAVSLEITPFAAGHMLGGALWQIKRETDEIVYAVDYNHKSERHLSPSMLETMVRPTLLITDASNALYQETARRQRDAQLFEAISSTISRNGNVLLPVDSAGRVLELLLTLDQHWTASRPNAPLIFLSHTAFNTAENARGHLEWMSDAVLKRFVTNRDNAFAFRHVNIAHDIEELKALPSPRVVLATSASLAPSFALDLFTAWAPDPANRVIFTERSEPGSVARRLLECPNMGTLSLMRWLRVPLDGAELDAYLAQRDTERAAETERKRLADEAQRLKRERAELYDLEGEDAAQSSALSAHWRSHDLYWERARLEGAKHVMFPSVERRAVFDAYGEHVRVEELMRVAQEAQERQEAEEKKEIDAMEVDETADVEEEDTTPTKPVLQKVEIAVNCAIQFIEFEGKSDGRAVKKILNHVQPRNLVLIGGTRDATEHLARYCQSLSTPPRRILAPAPGEAVDVTEASDIYRLHLNPHLLDSVEFKEHQGVSLAYVDGIITVPPEEQDEEGQWKRAEPYLDVLPSKTAGHKPLYVGDVKLSIFRQRLLEAGFKAEFKGGILIVNNVVSLRREVDAQSKRAVLRVLGALCDEYHRVVELLYSQFAVI